MVPIDQAKAQLYYTFAAHSGDKGAQMALGYRLWSGIGTLENCGKAMGWYEQASQQGRHPAWTRSEGRVDRYPLQPWSDFSRVHLWVQP